MQAVDDFVWASAAQAFVVVIGELSGFYFVVEELLLFTVLIGVKHQIRPPFGTNVVSQP